MPTYEYECKTCGKVFDVFQSIIADPLRRHRCEDCKRVRAVRRLLGTGGALIFKGSGFYTTDYRSESFKKDAKAESDAGKPKKDSEGSNTSKDGATGSSPPSGSGTTGKKKSS